MHPEGEESKPAKGEDVVWMANTHSSDHQPHSPAQLLSCRTHSPEDSWDISKLLQAVIPGSSGTDTLRSLFASLILVPYFPDPMFPFLSVKHILQPTDLSKQNMRLFPVWPNSFRSPRSAPLLKVKPHTKPQGHQDLL